MQAQTAKRMIQLQTWTAQVNACKQSGLPTKQWCMENGIKLKTYYNRTKRLREEALDFIENTNVMIASGIVNKDARDFPEPVVISASPTNRSLFQKERPTFVSLPTPSSQSASISVRMNEYAVDIQNDADEIMVERVLRVVARL